MSDPAQLLADVHDRFLGLLDAPELEEAPWEFPGYALPTFVRSVPMGAYIVCGDADDVDKVRSFTVHLRGRDFAGTCTFTTIADHLAHRRQPGRCVRPCVAPTAIVALVRRQRAALAAAVHRSAQALATLTGPDAGQGHPAVDHAVLDHLAFKEGAEQPQHPSRRVEQLTGGRA